MSATVRRICHQEKDRTEQLTCKLVSAALRTDCSVLDLKTDRSLVLSRTLIDTSLDVSLASSLVSSSSSEIGSPRSVQS